MPRLGYLGALELIFYMSYTRDGIGVHGGPTVRADPRYEVEGGDGFGTYQDRHVHADELVPSRNGINPVSNQVKTRFHLDALGTDLRSMKMSEEMRRNIAKIPLASILPVHLTSVVRGRATH